MESAPAGLPAQVLAAFGVQGEPQRLPGGTGRSARGGDVVVKPADNEAEAAWAANVFADLAGAGFRSLCPVRAGDGRWVVDGWTAARFLRGKAEPRGRWADVLAAGRSFHAALRGVSRPEFIDARTDQRAAGDRQAWGEADVRLSAAAQPLLTRLLNQLRPFAATCQLIHGDLSGNVLFADDEPPGIIDLSPYWCPGAYAGAIVAVDALLWYDADPSTIGLLDGPDTEMLLRALIFRLVAEDIHARRSGRPPAIEEYDAVAALIVEHR